MVNLLLPQLCQLICTQSAKLCNLCTKTVIVGDREEKLTVPGVAFILGYDLAGSKVLPAQTQTVASQRDALDLPNQIMSQENLINAQSQDVSL